MSVKMASGVVFVTVGTTSFDQLISAMTHPNILRALHRRGYSHLKLQIGSGSAAPPSCCVQGVQVESFDFKPSIAQDILQADLVISHAGAGSCLEVLEAGRPLLVVVNEDLMGNHQLELAHQLYEEGYLYYCICRNLRKVLEEADFSKLLPYPPGNPGTFSNFLDTMMGFESVY